MHSVTLLTVAFAALSNALPQTSTPPPAKGTPKGGSGGIGGLLSLVGFSTPPGADGPDLRPLAEFLKNPNLGKSQALSFLDPLVKVPEIVKYAPAYLDWRNISQVPFIVAMPYGPKPTGCSPYEILIGMLPLLNTLRVH